MILWYSGCVEIRNNLEHTISFASCLRRFWLLPLLPGVEWLEAFRNIGRFGCDIVVTLLLDSWKDGNRSFDPEEWEITGGVIGVCAPEASLYNPNSTSPPFSFPMFRRNVINSVWEREAQSLPLANINLSPGLILPSDNAGSLTKALMVWRRTVDSSVWHKVNPRLPFIWIRNLIQFSMRRNIFSSIFNSSRIPHSTDTWLSYLFNINGKFSVILRRGLFNACWFSNFCWNFL